MTRLSYGAAAAAIVLSLTTAVAASAATTPQQKTLLSMVGTWHCVSTTSSHKTYRETDTYAMYGPWLKESGTYPAQEGEKAGTNASYLRYDAGAGRWVMTSVDTDGSYLTAYSTSKAFDGSHWLVGYPAAPHASATIHLTGETYTTDASYTENGKPASYKAVCKKA